MNIARRLVPLLLCLTALLPAQADLTAGPDLAFAWRDGRLPGPGLPDVLAQGVVVAVAPLTSRLTVSAPWPSVDILLQAVQVRLQPSFAVAASPVQRVLYDALPPPR